MVEGVDVVLLAGFGAKSLYPVATDSMPLALLPVGNKPLISYGLSTVACCGAGRILVMVSGTEASQQIRAYLADNPPDKPCEVVEVDGDAGSAGALRLALQKIQSSDFLLATEEIVSDCNVAALMAAHRVNAATATVMLGRTRTSPSSETKPGKAPKNVDYIGLDERREQLLFHASKSGKQAPDLKVAVAAMKRAGAMTVRTDLVDLQVYMFNAEAVSSLLQRFPTMTSVKEEVLPLLVQQQFRAPRPRSGGASEGDAPDTAPEGSLTLSPGETAPQPEEPQLYDWQRFNHSRGTAGSSWPAWCGVIDASKAGYCELVDSIQAYADINREVVDPARLERLTGRKPSKYDNHVPTTARLGNRTTVGAACAVGERTVLGDKCGVKRSVIGSDCRIGNNCKVVNSVLMDGITLGDNCDVRNTVICSGCRVGEDASLRDCQVGYNYDVAENADHKDETLARE